MSRYTKNRAYRHNRAAVRKWKYEQMSLPKNESEEVEMANRTKRTAQQQAEFVEEVLRLRGDGLTFTAITELIGGKYNANMKDTQNAYYRYGNPLGTRPDHHDHEEEDPDVLAARVATEEMEKEMEEALRRPPIINCVKPDQIATVKDISANKTAVKTEEAQPDELPEIIMQRSSKTRKTMIRCENDGVKIKIDVTDPKVLKGVMDELAMMLNAAVWGA